MGKIKARYGARPQRANLPVPSAHKSSQNAPGSLITRILAPDLTGVNKWQAKIQCCGIPPTDGVLVNVGVGVAVAVARSHVPVGVGVRVVVGEYQVPVGEAVGIWQVNAKLTR